MVVIFSPFVGCQQDMPRGGRGGDRGHRRDLPGVPATQRRTPRGDFNGGVGSQTTIGGARDARSLGNGFEVRDIRNRFQFGASWYST
jgi:hypothetical protein